MQFTIIWEVGDGYVGKSRPQRFTMSLDDFDDDMSPTEIAEVIDDAIQDEGEQKITFDLSNDDVVQEIMIALTMRGNR